MKQRLHVGVETLATTSYVYVQIISSGLILAEMTEIVRQLFIGVIYNFFKIFAFLA